MSRDYDDENGPPREVYPSVSHVGWQKICGAFAKPTKQQGLDEAFAKLADERKAGTRPATTEEEARGGVIQAGEVLDRAVYNVDKDPEAVLEAARNLNKARTLWLKVKGAIPW